MEIKELRDDLKTYLSKHNLDKKYKKAKNLFEQDPFYPSLNTELVESIEIIALTNHYK